MLLTEVSLKRWPPCGGLGLDVTFVDEVVNYAIPVSDSCAGRSKQRLVVFVDATVKVQFRVLDSIVAAWGDPIDFAVIPESGNAFSFNLGIRFHISNSIIVMNGVVDVIHNELLRVVE